MATIRTEANRLGVPVDAIAAVLNLSPNGEAFDPETSLDASALQIIADVYTN